MHDGATAEEEKCLEERVGKHVIDGTDRSSDAKAKEHVAKLRNRRVRHDTLDVVLRHANGRCEECRQASDPRDGREGERMKLEEGIHARDQIHPRGDHCRCVNKR